MPSLEDSTPIQEIINFWIYLAVSLVIFTPTTIYYTIEYSKILKSELVRKRYPRIVILTAIVGICSFTIRPSLMLFVFAYTDDNAVDPTKKEKTFIDTIHSILYPPITHGFVYMIAWRVYLLYYKFQFIHAAQQVSWMQHINKKV